MRTFLCMVLLLLLSPCGAQQESWPDLSSISKATGGGEKDAAIIVGIEEYAYLARIPGARLNANAWHA